VFKFALFVVFFWSCVVYGSPDSGLLRTSNACLFCNKTFKNLFPCNLRPFAIEITLAIFRHSPSCSHNNWIVTVDEMGCEVTSCKLNSPTPPHPTPPSVRPPRAVKMSFCCVSCAQTFASHLVRKCSVTSVEFFFFCCQMLIPSVSERSACLSLRMNLLFIEQVLINYMLFIPAIHNDLSVTIGPTNAQSLYLHSYTTLQH
jgi:hypothetical protein